jgi:hypothetical protein
VLRGEFGQNAPRMKLQAIVFNARKPSSFTQPPKLNLAVCAPSGVRVDFGCFNRRSSRALVEVVGYPAEHRWPDETA